MMQIQSSRTILASGSHTFNGIFTTNQDEYRINIFQMIADRLNAEDA